MISSTRVKFVKVFTAHKRYIARIKYGTYLSKRAFYYIALVDIHKLFNKLTLNNEISQLIALNNTYGDFFFFFN